MKKKKKKKKTQINKIRGKKGKVNTGYHRSKRNIKKKKKFKPLSTYKSENLEVDRFLGRHHVPKLRCADIRNPN